MLSGRPRNAWHRDRRDDFSDSPRQIVPNFSVRKYFYAHFNMVNFLSPKVKTDVIGVRCGRQWNIKSS